MKTEALMIAQLHRNPQLIASLEESGPRRDRPARRRTRRRRRP